MKKIHKKFIYTEFGQEVFNILSDFLPHEHIMIQNVDEYITHDKAVLKQFTVDGNIFSIYTDNDMGYVINVNDEYFIHTYKNEND